MLAGFTQEDSARVQEFLRRVRPHLVLDETCIVGGLAIRHHTARLGPAAVQRPVNDVDLAVSSIDSVLHTIADDFIIAHVHMDFVVPYLAIVDPVSRLKGDIFGWIDRPPIGPVEVDICGQRWKMRSLEDQLVNTVTDLYKLFEAKVIDEKQFLDAAAMIGVADMAKAEKAWSRFHPEEMSLARFYRVALACAEARPHLVASGHHHWKARADSCDECIDIPGYPRTPLPEVFDVLTREGAL